MITVSKAKYCPALQWLTFGFFFLCTLTVTANDSQNIIRPKIKSIADKLQKDNMVHFGYAVGFSAKPETNNKYFKLYKRLKSKATNQELVELTNSKSEVMVIYAFNILHSRNYEGLKDIFLNYVSDTTWFWTAGGCTGFVDRINWFMLRRLKPTEDNTSKNFLTKDEFDLYCNRFKKDDTLFSCD
jgi:hypothetical protein